MHCCVFLIKHGMYLDQSPPVVLMIKSAPSELTLQGRKEWLTNSYQSLQAPRPKGLFSFNQCGSADFNHAEYGLIWAQAWFGSGLYHYEQLQASILKPCANTNNISVLSGFAHQK